MDRQVSQQQPMASTSKQALAQLLAAQNQTTDALPGEREHVQAECETFEEMIKEAAAVGMNEIAALKKKLSERDAEIEDLKKALATQNNASVEIQELKTKVSNGASLFKKLSESAKLGYDCLSKPISTTSLGDNDTETPREGAGSKRPHRSY